MMKKMIFAICVVLCAVMQSCDKEEFVTNYAGRVLITPSTAKNGDNVVVCVGDFSITNEELTMGIGSGLPTTPEGDNMVKKVVYYMDGEPIMESSDIKNNLSVTYKVANLSVGSHTISAEFIPAKKNYTILGTIGSAVLTVEE